MKKFSKLFWVALVVVAVLACTAIGVFAAETTETTNAVVYGDFVDLTKVDGDSFNVGFHFKENDTKVECGKITLTWDETKLTAGKDSIAIGAALENAQFGSKIEEGKAVIAWAGSSISEETATGTLFTVKFTKASADVTDALINVTVDDFGYTETFKAVDVAETVKVNNAFANDGSTIEMPYAEGEEHYGEPVAFLNAAIQKAETGEGQTVNVLLSADMVFTADAVIGTAGANHVGKVVITGPTTTTETTTGEGDDAVTTTTTTPNFGILVYCDVILNMYGNFEFDDLYYTNTAKSLDETVSSTWSTGGVMNFVEGLGKFGHPDPDTTDNVNDFGLVKLDPDYNKRPHISGHVEAYTGSYWTISGNFYKTGVDVKDPSIKLLGNVQVNYVFGQLHNGGTNTTVSGTATLEIGGGGRNYISSILTGANYNAYNTPIPTNITINNPHSQIAKFIVGTYANGSNTVTYNKENKFTVILDYLLVPTSTMVDKFTLHSGNRGTTKGLNVDLTINDGSYRSIISFGMDGTHNANSMRLTDSTVKVTINGGTFQKSVYCGSILTGATDVNKIIWEDDVDRTVTVNGGTFQSTLYGGSYITCGDGSYHGSAVKLNIYGGTFSQIHGGSDLQNSTAYHGKVLTDGTVTEDIIIVRPGNNKAFTQTSGHFIGGSNIKVADAEHKSNTTVYLKDINTRGANTQTGSLKSTFASSQVIAAGSQISDDGIHSGNSKLIIQRCNLHEGNVYVAGSRIDGNNSEHSGTSKLIIDGNTGLKKVDGAYTDEEIVGTNGWNNLYEVGTQGWFGGSFLNGWYQYTEANPDYDPDVEGSTETITVTGTTSNAKQTGESSVEIIGPDDYVSENSGHMTQIRGAYGAGIYGGHYYYSSKMTLPQQNNSYVEIKGTVRTGVGNVSTNPTYVYAFGGSRYNTKLFTYTDDSFIPSSKVIIDGSWTGTVVGGINTSYNSTGAEYKHNVGVTLKTGSVGGSIYPCSWVNTGTYTSFSGGKTTGYGLIEIYDTYGIEDNDLFDISILGKFTSGTRGIKLIGNFSDTDSDDYFKLITNVDYNYLDLAQATGSSVLIQKRTAQKDEAGNTVKDENGNTVYNYTQTCKSGTVERVNDVKTIYFAKSGSTLESATSSLAASKQVDVNPTMTFANLLATDGLMIYNTYDPVQTEFIWNNLQAYSNYTKFDCVSTSPNAFVFYAADADGNATGEALTQIPADPSQKIIVQTGTTYSAPVYLTRHELRFATAAIEFAENLAVTLRIKAPALNSYGYSDYYLKATINGYTTTVTEYTEEADGRYKFVFSDIPPYLMAHDMDIVLYAKHGEEDVTALNLDYGIYTYARSRLDKSTDDNYKSVIVNMLNYGDAAQVYMASKDTEFVYSKLATEAAGITEEEQSLYATSDLRTFNSEQNTKYTTIDNPTASFKAVTLYFGSTVQIEYRFLPDTTINPENLKVKLVNNETGEECCEFTYADFVDAGNDDEGNWKGYKVTFDKLYANQMSDVILATVYDGDTPISNTLSYSIETYVSKKLTSTDSNFVALITTMMKYGDSVVAYK